MRFHLVLILLGALATTACGHSFEANTPKGFVELEDDEMYDYRATTADGLVIAAREFDNDPKGEMDFWEQAMENQIRKSFGYALLGKSDVKSADGVAGKQLRFGHDEGNTPHLYTIALFVTEKKIFVVEAGGTKELMDKNAAQVQQAFSQFRTD